MAATTTLDTIDNSALRERFERLRDRDGLTLDAVADATGFGDGTVVARKLGLRAHSDAGRPTRRVRYDDAVRLARALDLDPWEVGV